MLGLLNYGYCLEALISGGSGLVEGMNLLFSLDFAKVTLGCVGWCSVLWLGDFEFDACQVEIPWCQKK